MPAEDPVCARAGEPPKLTVVKATAAAVTIATAWDARLKGCILLVASGDNHLGQIAVPPAWDSARDPALNRAFGQAMAGTIDGQLKADQLTASTFAKTKQGRRKSGECGSTGASGGLCRAVCQGM